MCNNSKFFPNFWGLDAGDFNCIRRCLVREDEKYRKTKPENQRNDCLSNEEIDEYHDTCFKECNVSTLRYPGVSPLPDPLPNLLNPQKSKQ
jgi:hypothetical protein